MIVLLPTLESTRPFEGHGRTRSVFDRYHIVSAQDLAEAMERPAKYVADRRARPSRVTLGGLLETGALPRRRGTPCPPTAPPATAVRLEVLPEASSTAVDDGRWLRGGGGPG